MAIKVIPNTETVPVKLDSNGRLINKDGIMVDLAKTAPNLVLINAEGKLVNKDGETVTSAGGAVDCGGAANVDGTLIDAGSASSLY